MKVLVLEAIIGWEFRVEVTVEFYSAFNTYQQFAFNANIVPVYKVCTKKPVFHA